MSDQSIKREAAPLLLRNEIVLLWVSFAVTLVTLTCSSLWQQPVAWMQFMPTLGPALFLVALAIYARREGRMERLSLFMVSMSVYATFGLTMGIFIFMWFPITGQPIDLTLMRIDAMIGYSWPEAVQAVAMMPWLGKALAVVYASSLWQLLALICLLAWMNRAEQLHYLVLTGALALIGTWAFWAMFPSFGPAAYHTIPTETARSINLVVDSAYGAKLLDMAANGIAIITPDTIIGSIAFPSYHTVMACMALWFARNTKLLGPFILLNVPMIPAILVHGGHHAIDMMGGVLIFAAALAASRRILRLDGGSDVRAPVYSGS